MALLAKSESVTVGMDLVFSDNVPTVRSTGPTPKIPSTSLKPEDVVATPIDCFEILRLDEKVTVSVYSLPEKLPDPYDTDCSRTTSAKDKLVDNPDTNHGVACFMRRLCGLILLRTRSNPRIRTASVDQQLVCRFNDFFKEEVNI